jgi:hypothetical protein
MADDEMDITYSKRRIYNKPVQTAGNVPLRIDEDRWEDNIKIDFLINRKGIYALGLG